MSLNTEIERWILPHPTKLTLQQISDYRVNLRNQSARITSK